MNAEAVVFPINTVRFSYTHKRIVAAVGVAERRWHGRIQEIQRKGEGGYINGVSYLCVGKEISALGISWGSQRNNITPRAHPLIRHCGTKHQWGI